VSANKNILENRFSFNNNRDQSTVYKQQHQDQHNQNQFEQNLINRNTETVQCKLKINELIIQSDIYPYDSAIDLASRILAI
jgi:hypothetical protein